MSLTRALSLTTCLAASLAVSANASPAPTASHPFTGEQKAWAMFEKAVTSKSLIDRTIGVRALGLLPNNDRARQMAEKALNDPHHEVRTAAATALGQMHAAKSIPKLQKCLADKKIDVVMAAAHSLRDLKENSAAYGIYYDVLTGRRKSSDGLLASQMDTLHNPRELAKIGFEEGIGYVPFAGIGWDAWRYMHKKDPNPVRAVAASFLARDPDPATGVALCEAMNDKDWIVRAAAIAAIAERGDPALEGKVQYGFFDSNAHVRYAAAAAVIRLSAIEDVRKEARNR